MPQQVAQHIIIGTAGHVDHGKTTLIKALTGTDTDRLKEEKERGMTIDLGFASLTLPGGRKVGIVDVPGHERFLKNMLAGATGIDLALMVVAADEGVMPQTQEHLEILELLEARNGLVALTKCDVVDEEWLGLVEEDVRKALKGTFLADAPVVRVSGVTGAGVNELAEALAKLVEEAEERSSSGPFRLPVDRVFTLTGFGTVVTGTLVSGTVRVGDPVVILPQEIQSRARQIQVHGEKADEARAGTRVAMNLAGVEVADLERGSVIVPPGYLRPSRRIDIFIRMLPSAPKPLKHRVRVRLHTGTAEHIGRVTVLGSADIPPGGRGYVQFSSETPVVAARGDRFIVRSYSPMRTIGGGTVLDPTPERHRSGDSRVIEALETRRNGEPKDLLEEIMLKSPGPVAIRDAAARAGLPEKEAREHFEELLKNAGAFALEGDRVIHPAVMAALTGRIVTALEDHHASNPLRSGMPREDLRTAATRGLDQRAFGALLAEMERLGQLIASDNMVRLPGHEARLSEKERKVAETIEESFIKAGLNAPSSEQNIDTAVGTSDIFQYLVETGKLVKIAEGMYLHREAVEQAEAALRKHLKEGGRITVSAFRDLIGSSRKYVVPLLEYFDSKRITRRVGDERILIGS
ncbi:MAG: selenocysteine-specific translation elongation factor [Armatimonadetes bacterium]|nr:selenocysteine-specific translation elongation factor [Armatimonadota bacterium]